MTSAVIAATRLTLLVAWTAVVLPLYWPASQLRLAIAVPLVRGYWRVCCRLMGFEVRVRGRMHVDGPTLYVANHASYLDIPILGSVLPGFFVAKHEVAGWPGIGLLARVARTVFIERRARRSAEQRDELQRRLDKGESIILFPEGTSNDGNRVLPFKSALFSVAERNGGRLPVQPITVAYTRLDGMPMGRWLRPFYAWYGDMELAPHVWLALGLGRVAVEIEFHEPMSLAECGSRKALSARAFKRIAAGLAAANGGRPTGRPAEGPTEAPDEVPVR